MKKIAVIIDENGSISSFTEGYSIKLFAKDDKWKEVKEKTINQDELNSMVELRKFYNEVINDFEDCTILIVKKAEGIAYSVFYKQDYSVWELDGQPYDYLDEIIKKEAEHEIEEKEQEEVVIAKEIEKGRYLIDLNELQLTQPLLSSKKAIIPFLDKAEIQLLEVRCCHVPPWLIKQKEQGKIKMEVKMKKKNEFELFIKNRIKEEAYE